MDAHAERLQLQHVILGKMPDIGLLGAKQPQLPQPLLIRLVLQTLPQLRCPSLDTLQHLNVFLLLGAQMNIFSRGLGLGSTCEKDRFLPTVCHDIREKQPWPSWLPSITTGHCRLPAQDLHAKDPCRVSLSSPRHGSICRAALQGRKIQFHVCFLGSIHFVTGEALLEAKQPQFPQPLLIRLVLQTLHQLRCPSLDTLQHLNVSLVVRSPKLNTVFEVRPHQCRVQGDNHFPTPAGHTISNTSQNAIGFLGHLGTPLAHVQPAVNQHSQVLFPRAAFQPLFPKPVALHGVVVTQVQDPALSLVEPHTIGLSPSIQPVQPLWAGYVGASMLDGKTDGAAKDSRRGLAAEGIGFGME
ncbi:hypothetical protein QYF61_018567 [Mycteria americana]|uniref:Uncharacterized protein n=1 Tax=Mycteria americana TaxID=33587 RepID=A0AAN7NU04_MYCAM|nr:hypothetical protein QYF61_018567 [Mycteria americana]